MLFAAFCLLSAGLTGWILTRALLGGVELRHRLIAGLVVAESALLVPVHVAASLQLAGVTARLSPWHAALALAAILAAAAALLGRRPRVTTATKPAPREPIPTYLLVSGATIGGAYLIGAANAFGAYIIDFDAVSYHLLLPHHWLMDGTLAISEKTNWRFGMPGNGVTAMYWFYAAGLSRWTFLAQWPPLACLLASAYSLALGLTRSRNAALSCMAVVATLPIVYYQTFNGYIDVFAAAFLMGALALAQAAVGRSGKAQSNWAWYWVIGLAAGIALGSKLVYLAFAGPLVVWLVILAGWGSRRNARETARTAGALFAGIALTSAFWYLRGWLLAGNPVFPMRAAIGEWVLFPGITANNINSVNWAIGRWVHSRSEWLIYPWLEFRSEPSMTSYSVDTGVGAAFSAFVPLGLAFFCWNAWRRGADRQFWLWAAGLIYCGLVWWFPLHQTLRFGLVFMLLLVIAAGPLLASLASARNRLFEAVFCSAITITCAILALEPAAFIASRYLYDMYTRAAIYRYPTYVDDLPAGSTVMNLVAPNNFAMAGARLSNRVVGYFEVPRELTTEFLEARRIDYIVGHADQAKRVEGLANVRLIHSEIHHDPVGLGDQPWRIWKVDRANGATPSGDGL
jgi:hypothetical protein